MNEEKNMDGASEEVEDGVSEEVEDGASEEVEDEVSEEVKEEVQAPEEIQEVPEEIQEAPEEVQVPAVVQETPDNSNPPLQADMQTSLGGDDFDMGGPDEKITRGNKGMLIAFIIIVVLGGVLGFFWYQDKMDEDAWNVKLTKALKIQDDDQFKKALRDLLSNCSREKILAQIAFELGIVKDKEAVTGLVRLLPMEGAPSLEAAMALAKIGGKEAKTGGVDAVFAKMEKSVELSRAKYAWVLCMLGDDRGFAPLLEAVGKRIITPKSLPEFDPDIIIQMGTTPKLIKMADSPDAMLRMYAAMELGFRTDQDTVPSLLKLVKDEKLDVAEAAAISLGRTADDRAGPALLHTMKTKPAIKSSIINAVAQSVGAPGLEVIYNSMTDPADKYKVIGKFKQLKDPRSEDFLMKVLEEKFPGSDKEKIKQGDEIRNQALWILESIGSEKIVQAMYEKTLWTPVTEEQIPDPTIRYRQDDMARKIANGVVTWFAKVSPEGASDYLMKIYNANEPYSNDHECATRVKVDIGPLMDAMGRTGNQGFCSIIEPFLDKDEKFFFQAASTAMARLKCKGVLTDFLKRMQMTREERKEERFSPLLESRDWQMEDRLQERRNSIIAMRYFGDPGAAETLIEIVLDTTDDSELRTEAAASLAYCSDEKIMELIIEKIKDEEFDIVARAALMKGLWHNPTDSAVGAMFDLLEAGTSQKLYKAAAIVIGEASNPAYSERLGKLLKNDNEIAARAGAFAAMLAGDVEHADDVIELLKGQETKLVLRKWYENHEIFLTKDIFDSGRIFKRIEFANALVEKTLKSTESILWPLKYISQRLKAGWHDFPHGLTSEKILENLADAARNSDEYRKLAIMTIASLGSRGLLLTLQAEDGPQGKAARDKLRIMNVGS